MAAKSESCITMSAEEVFRLAESSIAQIKSDRQRLVNQAIDHVKNQVCRNHWFWFMHHQKYASREEAMNYAPEVIWAKKYGSTDEETCRTLGSMAKYVLADETRSDTNLYISRDDFRALT